MQKVKSYQINGLQVDVLSESNKGLQTELTAIYISVNGNEPVFVGGYLYPHITKKWAKKQLADFANAKIEFCADHCQYIPGRPSLDGFEGPYIGAGANEAEAYQDALDQAYMALEESEIPPLPKRAGSKKRGYCVLYVPKIAPVK